MRPRSPMVRAHGHGTGVVVDAVVGLQDVTVSGFDVRLTRLEVIVQGTRLAPCPAVVGGGANDGAGHRAVAVEMEDGALLIDEQTGGMVVHIGALPKQNRWHESGGSSGQPCGG